ncbi:hypothetical protein ACGFZL_12740 [Streptomyces sp. NPDC048182]|uniref:hypothetical protein n=1 Tax=unclassified Streptomyces TaxID=2593676 RepID=UPI0033B45B51
MKASLAWWDLTESDQTVDTLRAYLRDEGTDGWRDVPGLRLKCWLADREGNRWGALMLWESDPAPLTAMPPNRAVDLIGYPPTHRFAFDVEAAVEGRYDSPVLDGLGPALAAAR